ncbi:hypothetical protein [Microbacterium aurantiacum]|uniref:Integral membrane protein n=1 Tax=Microbacterium aurantiacum TaxID=162393 RepID=A0ABT8FT80_9MICO|nr:hypothetical protein [Microbacterium aurantiacum]MBN9199887.1 hypothetical protein [Microbacterium chocolatum]MDN4464107.1 hypothetical protein [Microbacterium aurantiacum]ODT10519.1 MAG: hypothetical protein ABS61_08040 [Microbacterium sp. SCN 70-18]
MTTQAPVRKRPATVTAAVVIVYVAAFLNVGLGILVMLSRYQVESADVLWVSLLGAAIILLGLLTLGLASGLARGSRLARIGITLSFGVLIVLHVLSIITTDGWDWSSMIQLALQSAALLLVWTPPGSRHFARIDAA